MGLEKSKKLFAIVCAVFMLAIIFQNVSAGDGNRGVDVDVFEDHLGNQHKVWRDYVDGIYQIFYANDIDGNETGLGVNGSQVTNSQLDVMYPQIAVDSMSGICYIIWVVEGTESEEFWYCGSNDFGNWTDARYAALKPETTGNPRLDMTATDYTLHILDTRRGTDDCS